MAARLAPDNVRRTHQSLHDLVAAAPWSDQAVLESVRGQVLTAMKANGPLRAWIKATRKYENPIEFPETHKLWMDTNSKPMIRAADDQATFNRLHPIPFTVTIPPEEIDKSLPRKMLAEAEGILAWAVQGAILWRQHGLGKPPEVIAANDDWRPENDQLGRFIEECCVMADSFSGRPRPLYECYRQWAEGAGENAITETLFGRRLKDRGFAKEHRRYGTVYTGIVLRAEESASA